jgi:hypothetical protein
MPRFNNVMEIFKLLDKSNCRECFEPTCLAFAGAVFKAQKRINECPRLSADIIEQFRDNGQAEPEIDPIMPDMERLKKEISMIDLASKAPALGGRFSEGRLTLKVLGKDVSIDSQGNFFSDIHAFPRLVMPILDYIAHGSGKALSGNWVPFRELPNGRAGNGLFVKQCEIRIKKVADSYPEFFEDLIRLFNGKQVEKHYESDISLVLYPLPKIPFLICYWLPDDGIESDLHLFFDAGAEDYLSIGSVFSIGAGMAQMFEKITLRHGL